MSEKERLPFMVPSGPTFEDAFNNLVPPIKSLAEMLFEMTDVPDLTESFLHNVGSSLLNFVESLEYLVRHSTVNGEHICFAKINHQITVNE